MVIGPRIWKTGLATTVALFITGFLPGLDPIITVITAVISLQPSVTESIKRGWSRIQATLLGAITGISLGFLGLFLAEFWDIVPVLTGLGVVLAIFVSTKLKIQDGAAIGAIAVVATMVNMTGSVLAAGGYRVASTLLGIIIATAINLVFIPPRHRSTLIAEFKNTNEEIAGFYLDTVNDFISCCRHDPGKAEQQVENFKDRLEKAKLHLSYYTDELGYRRSLTHLPLAQIREVILFEKIIKTLDSLLDRIYNIAKATGARINRKPAGEQINHEYGQLLEIIGTMAGIVYVIQKDLIELLITHDPEETAKITNQLDVINQLQAQLHQDLNTWHLLHPTTDYFQSLMEISIVAYDIEQSAEYLRRLAKKLIRFSHV